MVKDGRIPGASVTKGGHYHFPLTPAFNEWLERETKASARRVKSDPARLAILHKMKGIRAPLPAAHSVFYYQILDGKFAAVNQIFHLCATWIIEAAEAMHAKVPASRWPKETRENLLRELDRLGKLYGVLKGASKKV